MAAIRCPSRTSSSRTSRTPTLARARAAPDARPASGQRSLVGARSIGQTPPPVSRLRPHVGEGVTMTESHAAPEDGDAAADAVADAVVGDVEPEPEPEVGIEVGVGPHPRPWPDDPRL